MSPYRQHWGQMLCHWETQGNGQRMANLSPRASTPSPAKAARTVSQSLRCRSAAPDRGAPRRPNQPGKSCIRSVPLLWPGQLLTISRWAPEPSGCPLPRAGLALPSGVFRSLLRFRIAGAAAAGSTGTGTRAQPSGQARSPTATAHCPSLDNLDDFRRLLHSCPLGMPQLPD
jgi:hypothetical protein